MGAAPASSGGERRNGVVVRMPTAAERSGGAASSSSARTAAAGGERLAAPDWLTSSGKAAFRRIVRHYEADAPGWLTAVDVDLLGLAVEHLAVAKAASKAMRGAGGRYKVLGVDEAHGNRERKTPAHQVFREATAAYVALARELGLTPKARQELEVGLAGIGPDSDDDDGDDVLDG